MAKKLYYDFIISSRPFCSLRQWLFRHQTKANILPLSKKKKGGLQHTLKSALIVEIRGTRYQQFLGHFT